MSKELDKVIRYVYNEFGQEFGDIIVDLKHQLQAYKDKEDKLREYIDGDEVRVYNDKRLSDSYKDGYARCCVDILQILNEGGKE